MLMVFLTTAGNLTWPAVGGSGAKARAQRRQQGQAAGITATAGDFFFVLLKCLDGGSIKMLLMRVAAAALFILLAPFFGRQLEKGTNCLKAGIGDRERNG
jgi:hypothetical protein